MCGERTIGVGFREGISVLPSEGFLIREPLIINPVVLVTDRRSSHVWSCHDKWIQAEAIMITPRRMHPIATDSCVAEWNGIPSLIICMDLAFQKLSMNILPKWFMKIKSDFWSLWWEAQPMAEGSGCGFELSYRSIHGTLNVFLQPTLTIKRHVYSPHGLLGTIPPHRS